MFLAAMSTNIMFNRLESTPEMRDEHSRLMLFVAVITYLIIATVAVWLVITDRSKERNNCQWTLVESLQILKLIQINVGSSPNAAKTSVWLTPKVIEGYIYATLEMGQQRK